jgi:hypothetical protein
MPETPCRTGGWQPGHPSNADALGPPQPATPASNGVETSEPQADASPSA